MGSHILFRTGFPEGVVWKRQALLRLVGWVPNLELLDLSGGFNYVGDATLREVAQCCQVP